MKTNRIDRRAFLRGSALGMGALVMGGAAMRAAHAADKFVYVNTWGGRFQEVEDQTIYQPFTAATGLEVRPIVPTSFAKLKATVMAKSYEFDTFAIGEAEFYRAIQEDLVEPIDASIVKSESERAGNFGVGAVTMATLLTSRKDKFPNGGPQSWADFWDVAKFPGNRSLIDRPHTVMAYALLADGVPIDKLYPLDIDRAFRKLDEIKPHIKVWWTQASQSVQLLTDGEVDMIAMWSARAEGMAAGSVPVDIVWNQAEHYMNYWGVPKGTPRAQQAWQFVDFATSPKPQADFCTELLYGPANPKAFELVTPEVAKRFPSNPEHAKIGFRAPIELLAPQLEEIQQRWVAWKAA